MSEDFDPIDDGQPHCAHHQHDDRCGYGEFGDCYEDDDDYCCHCECCCTCLGCEYGPRDGMLMYPNGAPWADEALAAASHSTQPGEETK